MKNGIIQAGIVGFGYMGNFHLNRTENVEGIEVKSVYDIDREKLKEAEKKGVIGYDNYKLLLADLEIDLIIICTPNDVHCKYALEALRAQKNVLCEKPATMSVDEMLQIKEVAEKNHKIFTTHQNRRWDMDYKVVREVLKEKEIGEITTIFSQTYGQRGVCFGWRADDTKGGGMLYDWGIHLIDQLLQLFKDSKVIGVYAHLRSILTPVVDDYFELELEFDNDCIAHINVGTFALQESPRWYIFGDRGTLKLDDFTGEHGGLARIKTEVGGFHRIKTGENMGPSRTMAHLEPENLEKIELPKVIDTPFEFYENLICAVTGKKEPIVSIDEIVRDMEIVEAAFASSREGKKIITNI